MSRRRGADEGLTLVEMLIVVSLLGLVMFVIAATFLTILRVTPSTEYRIDDARSTRGLQTWLARDVASTPPNVYDSATKMGYVDAAVFASPSAAGVPASDVCTTTGTHVLFMAWVDRGVSYRAQYTIDGDAASGYEVVRTICGGDSGVVSLTGDVSNVPCAAKPWSMFDSTLATVELCFVSSQTKDGLLGGDRTQEITLSVASRNGDT